MGYTTNFSQEGFKLNKQLSPNMKLFLDKLNETRRMKRSVDSAFGIEGEFYVFGNGFAGQDKDDTIIEYNNAPSTQCGLWVQWKPNEDGTCIEWDGGEKFYNYKEWLMYLIHKILKPNGYVLNGSVNWSGEDTDDVGMIRVEENKVFITDGVGGKEYEYTLELCEKGEWVGSEYKRITDFFNLESVLMIDEGDINNTIIELLNKKD